MKDNLISVGDLLSQSFEIVKSRAAGFLGITVIPFAINFAIAFVGIVLFILSFIGLGIGGMFKNAMVNNPSLVITEIFGAIIIFALLVLIMGVVQSWGSLALIHYVLDLDEKPTIGTVLKKAWKHIISFWWLTFLLGFITFGGFMLFVVPGVFFYIWFIFAMFIFASENVKGMAALQKSKEYVKGYAGEVFARLIVLFVVNMGGQMIFSTIINIVPHGEKQLPLLFLISFINIFFSLLLSCFSIVYLSLIYKSLKSVKKDLSFTPSKKANWIYIGTAFAGIIVTIAFFSLMIFAVATLSNSIRNSNKANPYRFTTPTPMYYPQDDYLYASPSATPSTPRTGEL